VSSLVYVYAIAAAQTGTVVHGINGAPIRWLHADGLYAAVSDVPEEEFGEQQLNAGLTDMTWLGQRALAHQGVNQQLHEAADALIPLAFGTVFRDDARVLAMLRQQRTSLRERLERVRGRSEWVVAVHRVAKPDTGQSSAVQALQAQIAEAAPGRAHLLRKRLADVERDAARELERAAVERVEQVLRGTAKDVYAEPVPSDTVDRPLLRASVLVSRAREAEFVAAIDGLQTSSYHVLLTGPWPTYRFAGLEQQRVTATS
jgi:hypothetical protein